MRLTSSLTLLAAAVAAASSLTLVSSTTVTLPNLYACTPADIRVKATGNYTIEGRDNGSHKLVFRAHVNKGVKSVTWSAVELPANAPQPSSPSLTKPDLAPPKRRWPQQVPSSLPTRSETIHVWLRTTIAPRGIASRRTWFLPLLALRLERSSC